MILKDIPGFEGLYSICSDGRVYSHRHKKFLLTYSNKEWYIQIRLCLKGKQTVKRIHRLVAEAFLDKPSHTTEVNHKNGIKTDNRVENLEWVNRSENITHCFRVLKRKPVVGAQNAKSKMVIDLRTGIFYESATEAAIARDLNRHTAKKYIKKGLYDLAYC